MISTIVVSILVFVFLAIYIYHRIKAQRRLAAAFHQLEIANTKLEDTNTKLEDTNTKLEHANTKLELANTELEQKNEQLTVANERAEESSRMKTNFIQQISHEIRTPLNILSGFTQVLTTPGIELEEAEWTNINRQITENTNRITGLVNKMLEVSDVNSRAVIEKNDYVLAIQIAAQAAEDSHITTASHLNFDMQIGEGADSAMLQTNLATATRALTLVLDNARKFTKGAEALHHQETEPTEKKSAVLRIEMAGDKVQFIVEDTGIGVPPEEAEHIFDEFVQLNEYYDGTGIGLTVARSLARRLGGDIKMDASYTAGARFVMTL
jgi:signal transduction histidine kinase